MNYPRLEINLDKIKDNADFFVNLCRKNNIDIAGVVKVVNGNSDVVDVMINSGCEYIASSRLEQLINVNHKTMLIRMPMNKEIKTVVEKIDISLNSELDTIIKLNEEAKSQNKIHKILLMIDLGDLREGIMDTDTALKVAEYIENRLTNIKLYGVGTNLGCYGSIKPSVNNLEKLCNIAKQIEEKINRKLDMISGGATTSIPLLLDNKLPSRINNLRIGEAIIVGRDIIDLWGYKLDDVHKDAITLKAEVIEVKSKPSYPIGEMFLDAFGNKPEFKDNGIRKRALLAIGKQDLGNDKDLVPLDEKIKILGSSSDHLILDIEDCDKQYEVGDIISFGMFYSNVLYLSLSQYVEKDYLKEKIKISNI